MVHKHRHQGIDKGTIKITGEMNQRKGENHFQVMVFRSYLHWAASVIVFFPHTESSCK
jgi:hypothetical protein